MSVFELHIEVNSLEKNIIELLKTQCELSTAELKSAINKGALWLARGKRIARQRRLKAPLKIADVLHFYYNPDVLNQICPTAQLISDFQHYSIWYKPYGMLSQGSKWSDHTTIARYAQQHLPNERPCFIIHRLDRAATGLIMVGHSKKAAQTLTALFERKSDQLLEKHYQIIVEGDASNLAKPLIVEEPIDGKKAKSSFTFLQYDAALDASLMQVKIDSGRKHQIRKHAAFIAHPVIGDRLYNPTYKEQDKTAINLQLCAIKLSFNCPFENNYREIILPEGLRPALAKLNKKNTD